MKLHKIVGILLIVLLIPALWLPAEDVELLSSDQSSEADAPATDLQPVPYTVDEFPEWLRNVYRGEVLFWGSLPITYSVVSLTGSLLSLEAATPEATILYKVGAASLLSLGIVLADYILGELGDSD